MDPASAAVAFVGFSASIASLSALVLDSCNKIHSIAQSLRNAPKQIRRLFGKIQRLHRVIAEIEQIGNEMGDEQLGTDVQKDWMNIATIMRTDLMALEAKISKLQRNLDGKSLSKVHMTARVRMYFSTEEVDRYETLLSDHLETINLFLCMLSR